LVPVQGEFGSDIPAGDGKMANLFLQCEAKIYQITNVITKFKLKRYSFAQIR
jgi:hypothetical protein